MKQKNKILTGLVDYLMRCYNGVTWWQPIGIALVNYVESDLGCTSRIYFDNMTLTLHNMTLTSWKPCQHNTSVIAAKQTVINEAYVFSIKYRYSDVLLKNT